MSITLTGKQNKIYKGLQEIGGEAAEYFKSALEFYYNEDLPSRVSHLAHDAREIDGGLRDILSPKQGRKQIEEGLIEKGIDKIFGSELKNHKGHIASILDALGVDENDDLAKKWIYVATQFHKYAHRHGLWKQPRDFSEFEIIWDKYEDVLIRLIGSYYAIVARIDRLIDLKSIDDAAVGAVLNLIVNAVYSNYFFRHLNNVLWFEPLKNNGVFDVNTTQSDDNGNTIYWRVLPYLERVSLQTPQHPKYGVELIDIIKNIIKYSKDNHINNPYIWRSLIIILSNIPKDTIKQNLPVNGDSGFVDLLSLCSSPDIASNLTISDLGRKLLANFLDDDSMIEYAEAIVDAITDIKQGNRKRLLSDEDEAELEWEPYWVLEAFQKNGELVGKKSEKAVVIVANKLKKSLEYNQQHNSVNIIHGDEVYELIVSRVVKDDLEIDFEKNRYKLEIKQYSPKQLEGANVKEGLWGLINVDPETSILQPAIVSAPTKQTFIAGIKKNLPSNIDWLSTDQFEQKIDCLYEGLYEDYSQVWFKSLSGGDRVHANDANEVLTIILRDVLVARSNAVADNCKSVMELFLSDEYRFPLFKKFVLFFINKYWDNGFNCLFDKFLEQIPNALRKEVYEVELHDILRNHNSKFTKDLRGSLNKLIDDIPEYYLEQGEKYINFWKYKWLSPLKDNPDFRAAYTESRAKAGIKDDEDYEPERQPFHGGIVTHTSSLTKEEVIKKHGGGTLIEEFKKYEKKDWRKTFSEEPDREGLGDVFQQAVSENPGLFANKIGQYKDAPPFFIHRLLWGLKEAYKAKKSFEWENVLAFCQIYIVDNKGLLSETAETEDGDKIRDEYLWFIGDAADLIEEGANGDSIGSECFDKVSVLFDSMCQIVEGEKEPDTQRDAISYALNTTLGKVIRSNIVFGLRVARELKKPEKGWGTNKYERYFDKGIESYIWFGRYFPQIRYLDKEYAENKLEELSKRSSEGYEWQKFMVGYLTSSYVYDEICKLPSTRANYEKAISSGVFDKKEDDRLVHHVTISYLRGIDKLTENNSDGKPSLFWKLLYTTNKPEQRKRWLAVAGYFWSISKRTLRKDDRGGESEEPLNKDIVERVIAFWRWSYDRQEEIERLLAKDYHAFLGRLADLTIYLNKIDDEFQKWMLLCAPYSDLHHMSSFFIEYLTKFIDDGESMKRVGKIYLKILEGSTPTFRQEDIYQIVERLYQLKDDYPELKEDADKICNTYGERGQHFLKELYFKYQS